MRASTQLASFQPMQLPVGQGRVILDDHICAGGLAQIRSRKGQRMHPPYKPPACLPGVVPYQHQLAHEVGKVSVALESRAVLEKLVALGSCGPAALPMNKVATVSSSAVSSSDESLLSPPLTSSAPSSTSLSSSPFSSTSSSSSSSSSGSSPSSSLSSPAGP